MKRLYEPDDHDDEVEDYDWWHDADYDPVEHDSDLDDIDIVNDDPDCY